MKMVQTVGFVMYDETPLHITVHDRAGSRALQTRDRAAAMVPLGQLPRLKTTTTTKLLQTRGQFGFLLRASLEQDEHARYACVIGDSHLHLQALHSTHASTIASCLLDSNCAGMVEYEAEHSSRVAQTDSHPSNFASERFLARMRPEKCSLLHLRCEAHLKAIVRAFAAVP